MQPIFHNGHAWPGVVSNQLATSLKVTEASPSEN